MRGDGMAGKDRAGFLGVIADRDDKIEFHLFELIPGLAAGVAGVDAVVLLEHPPGERVDLARGMRARAVHRETAAAFLAEQVKG